MYLTHLLGKQKKESPSSSTNHGNVSMVVKHYQHKASCSDSELLISIVDRISV